MTAYNGCEILLKPECLQINSYQGQDSILIVTETVVAPPDIRGYSYVTGYNTANGVGGSVDADYYLPSGESFPHSESNQEGLDIAIQLSNFPQFSLVNNKYIYYMAST